MMLPNEQNTEVDSTSLDQDGTDSDYSLDYEYLGPRQPNYRNEQDADSDASELSCTSAHDGFDMWDEDPHSTNDFTWQSNEMKLSSSIKRKKKELDYINTFAPWQSLSFWRKEKGWPRQLANSISTTNHDQSANALSLVVSDFNSTEQLHTVYKDRIIKCGQTILSPATPDASTQVKHNDTTWLDNDDPAQPVAHPSTSNKFIETHASISLSSLEPHLIHSTVHNPSTNLNSPHPISSQFIPYTKYIKRHQFPVIPPQHAYLSLSFEPMCLAEKYGYMAIGGIEGEFELYCCMGTTQPTKIWGTKFKGKNNVLLMINSIQIVRFKTETDYRYYLIACMNDAGILIYQLPHHQDCQAHPTCQLQAHIRHFDRVPINDARVSPDGQHLICVGDDACVFHLSITQHHDRLSFSSPRKLPLEFDKSISPFSSQYVAWSRSSRYFAQTSDSHSTVLVWRTSPKLELIHRIDAAGYTYAIQFHPELEGVLAFSNRYGYFHTLNLDETVGPDRVRHEITMVSFRGEKERKLRILAKINGLQWSKDGQYLYVSTKKRVLAYQFLKISSQVPSLERITGLKTLALMEEEGRSRKRRKRSGSRWSEAWENIPAHIRNHIITDTHLASHW